MGIDPITLAAAKAYTDSQRLAGERIVKYEPHNGTFSCYPNEEVDGLNADLQDGTFGLFDGYTGVELTVNGKKYYYDTSSFGGAFQMGNLAIAGLGDDTGETFLIMVDFDQNKTLAVSAIPTVYEVEFCGYSRRISQIDPKYIPGYMPEVNIKEALSVGDSAVVLDGAVTFLHKPVAGIPIVLSVVIEDTRYTGVTSLCSHYQASPHYELYIPTIGANVVLEHDGDVWKATVVKITA